MSRSIPDRWLDYSPIGLPIEGTRFIAFKVPLKTMICSSILNESTTLTPEKLLDFLPRLGLVIDLTNTTRYYNPEVFLRNGVKYVKLTCLGRQIPSNDVRLRFNNFVNRFLKENKYNDKLIGVHCTHGINRTGYLICSYMVSELKMDPEDAIERFVKARGHSIERDNYIDGIKTMINISNSYEREEKRNNFRHNTLNETSQPRSNSYQKEEITYKPNDWKNTDRHNIVNNSEQKRTEYGHHDHNPFNNYNRNMYYYNRNFNDSRHFNDNNRDFNDNHRNFNDNRRNFNDNKNPNHNSLRMNFSQRQFETHIWNNNHKRLRMSRSKSPLPTKQTRESEKNIPPRREIYYNNVQSHHTGNELQNNMNKVNHESYRKSERSPSPNNRTRKISTKISRVSARPYPERSSNEFSYRAQSRDNHYSQKYGQEWKSQNRFHYSYRDEKKPETTVSNEKRSSRSGSRTKSDFVERESRNHRSYKYTRELPHNEIIPSNYSNKFSNKSRNH